MYHALYRKYRPNDFDSVVGQDSIIKTLKNSIKNNNFSHAYMFFGPRGTGKTTVSKIFARNVNCLSPKDGIACKKCDACKVSFSHDCIDIIEIDAASNNGVNEIRELRNNVNLVPSELKYKVYIIDEVHMLSDAAFNALLKTLEEPPEHIIFILATTDPQKVPETIISRCQCFSFKRISEEKLRERLEYVCKEEKIKIDSDVLDRIALFSDGGLRDALGSLDKLVSYTSDKITMEDFNDVNGVVSDLDISNFLHSILLGNIQEVLSHISTFNNNGKNLIQIMIQLVNYSRNLVVDYYLNSKEIDFSIDLLQDFVNELNDKMVDIKKSSNTKVYIEMFLLKFINDKVNSNKFNEKVVVDKNIFQETNNSKSDLNNNDFSNEKSDKNISREIKTEEKQDKNISQEIKNEEKHDEIISQEINKEKKEEKKKEKEVVEKEEETDSSYEDSASTIPKILNLDEIMKVRVNNTMATADKQLLKVELGYLDLLRDFSFDQEIGYLVNSILDSNIRAVGPDNLIISYDSEASVNQNLVNILKLNEVYNKITNSNKNIAIISDDQWDSLKKEYIEKMKSNEKYQVQEEPNVILEEIKNDDIISNSAISLFGDDIVEIE